jgi:hypothetical protein
LGLGSGANLEVWVGAYQPGNARDRRREAAGRAGFGTRTVPFRVRDGALELDVDEELVGCWLYVVEARGKS